MDAKGFAFNQKIAIQCPQSASAYAVLVSEWRQLRASVSAIRERTNFYLTFGSAFVGLGFSAIFRAGLDTWCVPTATYEAKLAGWVIGVSSLIVGCALLGVGRAQAGVQIQSVGNAMQLMTLIEARLQQEGGEQDSIAVPSSYLRRVGTGALTGVGARAASGGPASIEPEQRA
jgi:hypothetical protein